MYEPEKYEEQIRHVEALQEVARLKWMSMQTKTLNSVMLNQVKHPSSLQVAKAAALSSKNVLFSPEREANPLGYKEFITEQKGLNKEVTERSGPILRSEVQKDPLAESIPASKTLPRGIKQVFEAQIIGGAGGGHINYKLLGNFTKEEINIRLKAGEVLYEFVNGDPIRLTILHGGVRSRRQRKYKNSNKTKRCK